MTIRSGSKFICEDDEDKTVFTVQELGHWSTIENANGNTDRVKWFHDDYYIGFDGTLYRLVETD